MTPMSRRGLATLALTCLLLAGGCRDRQAVTDDQSTPQAAIHSLVHEMDRLARPDPFDARELERFFIAQSPPQREYVQAWIDLLNATRELHDQTRARFGREDARQVLGPARPGEDHIRRFAEPSTTGHIDDDRAVLITLAGQTLHFARDGDEWRIVPGGPDVQAAELEQAISIMRGLAEVLSEVARGIQTRDVETAADARQIIAEQTHRVVLGSL